MVARAGAMMRPPSAARRRTPALWGSVALLSACILAASLSAASAQSPIERVQSLLAWSDGSAAHELPVEAKKSMLHDIVAKRLAGLGSTFSKFAREHKVALSNKTQELLEKSKAAAAHRAETRASAATQELTALKKTYHEVKLRKRALVKEAKLISEEIKLAEVNQKIHEASATMKATKKRMYEVGYQETAQKHALTFQKLYTIKYGATGYRYNNNPEHPGVHTENDGGAYAKHGWVIYPGLPGEGAQQCEEYSKCNDVFIPGQHEDGSGTCNDDPMYYDCEGDSCQYYEEYPEECGQHDADCSGDDTGHWKDSLQNPCSSQGTKMQGCCVCQHHVEQWDGCGTNSVGLYSEGWDCSESPTEYLDAGCGTWETCEERLQKESWYDRNGHKCEDYEENPEMCDEALASQYKGHDAAECCPKELDRPCGHKPCPAGTYGVSAGRRSETVDSTCTKCPAGKYGPAENQHSNAACKDCPAGKYQPDEGKTAAGDCLDCAKGKYSTTKAASSEDACTDCAAGKYNTDAGSDAESYCTQCSAGTYNTNTGSDDSSDCTDCAAGKANPNKGADSADACVDCEAGKYEASDGSSSCDSCAQGKHSNAVGATSEDTCTQCAAGKYDGTDSASVATSEGDCAACPAGKYQSSTGAESDEACDDCPKGTYGATEGLTAASECTDCPAGTYGSNAGKTAEADCSNCGAGTYSTATGASSSSTCTGCSAGKYGVNDGAASADDCTNCAAGSAQSTAGETSCVSCGAGKYAESDGASACTDCETGKSHDQTGSSSASDCAAPPDDACGVSGGDGSSCAGCDGEPNSGKVADDCGVCDGDGTSCAGCDGVANSGKVVDVCGICDGSETDSTKCDEEEDNCGVMGGDDSSCAGCDGVANSGLEDDECGVCGGSGKDACGTCDGDDSACEGCDGVAHSGKVADECGVCDGPGIEDGKCDCNGNTEDACGTCGGDGTGCDGCDGVPGSGKQNDACGVCGGSGIPDGECDCNGNTLDVCGDCGGGGTAASNSCPCPAGETGAYEGACSDCAAGKHKSSAGSEACTDCAAGFYSDAAKASDCTQCGGGTYSEAGSTGCTSCPAGKYGGVTGGTSLASCTDCAAGTYSAAPGASSSDTCVQCDAGTYSASAGQTSSSACTKCAAGKFGTSAGANADSACTDCPAGSASATTGADSSDTCVSCAIDTYADAAGSAQCTACPSGKLNDQEGASSADACKEPCNAGYSGPLGGPCVACSKGQYKPSEISGVGSYGEHGHSEHECFNCPADTYQDEEGSTACKGCPAHSTSPETSDAKSDCECKPGYESDDDGVDGHADGHACVACPKMEFKTPTGAGACAPCEGSSHSDTASAVCKCNHGYSGPDGDGSGCENCPPGTYKDLTGNAPCIDCPTGKHGITAAATSDEFCRETYKIEFGASLISNHPSASGNQGSIWNYGSSKDNEFMGGEKGADAGGTVRYGGNGAYGEWAIDKDATNFYSTDTWNGPNGGNPGGRTVYDEDYSGWYHQHKKDSHHDNDNLDQYLAE